MTLGSWLVLIHSFICATCVSFYQDDQSTETSQPARSKVGAPLSSCITRIISMYQDNHARTSGNGNNRSSHARKATGSNSQPKDIALESQGRKDTKENGKGAKVSSIYYYVAATIHFSRTITIHRILQNSILSPALPPPLETVLASAEPHTPEMKLACSLSQLPLP